MDCPYCGAELIYSDFYGIGNYAAYEKYGYGFKKTGDIFKCPNAEGFKDEEEAIRYLEEIGVNICQENIESICCDSFDFNGYFHTIENHNLINGYPC